MIDLTKGVLPDNLTFDRDSWTFVGDGWVNSKVEYIIQYELEDTKE